MRLILLHK